ncbi:MAG: alpha-L-fucosidase [Acidobacteriota bacterium]|nr:alpha-L-fucosidase [Acidobacteriota bacterium]
MFIKFTNLMFVAAMIFSVLPASLATQKANSKSAEREVFQPTWESLKENYKTPEWFNQAKFGIFIHWGLYAVPAYHNEWYAKHMYGQFAEWHTEHYGAPDKFGYKDFIPLFKAEKYDPDAWAELFKKAGAKYVVPVAEHHDGFAMYDSALTKWNAKNMGPHRDLIDDLATAVRRKNLIFGLSYHRMEHHTFMYPTTKMPTDLFDPKYADFYGPPIPGDMDDGNASKEFQADWLARCKELVDKYHPQLVYFDNGVNHRNYDDVKLQFAAYYYNRALEWNKQVSIATKKDAYFFGSIKDYEKIQRAPTEISQQVAWQVDEPIAGNSWGYVSDLKYRSTASIVGELIDIASKGGNLMLNVSPRADGTIPDEQQKILLEIGKWLETNGEAIYGSRAWTKFGEGEKGAPQYRFTTNKDALYVFGLNVKANQALIKSLSKTDAPKIKKIEMLGLKGKINYTQDEIGLKVELSAARATDLPFVLKISGLKINK